MAAARLLAAAQRPAQRLSCRGDGPLACDAFDCFGCKGPDPGLPPQKSDHGTVDISPTEPIEDGVGRRISRVSPQLRRGLSAFHTEDDGRDGPEELRGRIE